MKYGINHTADMGIFVWAVEWAIKYIQYFLNLVVVKRKPPIPYMELHPPRPLLQFTPFKSFKFSLTECHFVWLILKRTLVSEALYYCTCTQTNCMLSYVL